MARVAASTASRCAVVEAGQATGDRSSSAARTPRPGRAATATSGADLAGGGLAGVAVDGLVDDERRPRRPRAGGSAAPASAKRAQVVHVEQGHAGERRRRRGRRRGARRCRR